VANPIFIDCPKDVWTKVATNVTHGQITKATFNVDYEHTYRETGDAAPVNDDEGIRFHGHSLPIAALQPIDVYIFTQEKNGKVRIDL